MKQELPKPLVFAIVGVVLVLAGVGAFMANNGWQKPGEVPAMERPTNQAWQSQAPATNYTPDSPEARTQAPGTVDGRIVEPGRGGQ